MIEPNSSLLFFDTLFQGVFSLHLCFEKNYFQMKITIFTTKIYRSFWMQLNIPKKEQIVSVTDDDFLPVWHMKSEFMYVHSSPRFDVSSSLNVRPFDYNEIES